VCGLNRYAILFLALMLSSMLLMSACRNRVDDSDLVNAWTLCEALEYEEAFPIVREYLFLHPDNSVAHYLLGKCYQQRENPALTLAKGELDMALFLFDRDGDLSVLSEAMTGSEYRATLHCDIVLVLLRTIIEAEEQGMPPNAEYPFCALPLNMQERRPTLIRNQHLSLTSLKPWRACSTQQKVPQEYDPRYPPSP
jgi:tetratricopeptide (TPR) repeat protein